MRKFLPQISLITIFILAIGFFAVPREAHADLLDFSGMTLNFVYGLLAKILWALVLLAGKVFFLIGGVIDGALAMSFEKGFYNAEPISLAWGIIRDIANMFFIFILIYEGVRTVLNLGNLVTVRKTITSVIIAALFLNFSLFFTKAIIDVSNLGAAWFMQGIIKIGGDPSVSYSIGSTLGMEKLVSRFGGDTSFLKGSDLGLESFMVGALMLALMCVAIYVFSKFVFLIVGRIVAFIFLLITAPIGFVGPLVPMLKDYSTKWWKELWDQAMMLPMFFLMVYLTLFIVDRIQVFLAGAAVVTSHSDANAFVPANYLIFIIIIMMLLKALKVAEDYSGEIGKMVGGLAQNATTFVAGAGFAGTIGRAASALRSSNMVQDFAAKNQFTGRLALGGLNSVATAGLGAGSAYKGVLKSTGLDKTGLKDTFKSADKGHEGVTKDEIETEKERMKLVVRADRKLARQQYLSSGGTGLMGMALRGAGKAGIPYVSQAATDAADNLKKAGGFARAGEDLKKDKDVAKAQKEENVKIEEGLMTTKAGWEKKIKDANDAWGNAMTSGNSEEMTKQHAIEEKAKEELEKHNKKIADFNKKKEGDDKAFAEAERKKKALDVAEAIKEDAPAAEKPAPAAEEKPEK